MKGVTFTPPPTSLMADATRIVTDLAKSLPPGSQGGIIAVATDTGWNAAVVHRAGERFQVASWIGKDWTGSLTGGGAVRTSW